MKNRKFFSILILISVARVISLHIFLDYARTTEPIAKFSTFAEQTTSTPSNELSVVDSKTEHQNISAVSWHVYKTYFKAVNSNLYIYVVAAIMILSQVGLTAIEVFISIWVNFEEQIIQESTTQIPETQNNSTILENETKRTYCILNYFIVMAITVCVFVFRTYAFLNLGLRASITLHARIFGGIIRTSMHFFNNNPLGRILNRFVKDIGRLDVLLPISLLVCLGYLLDILATVIVTVMFNYYLLLPTILAGIAFYFIRCYYIQAARNIIRIEAITSSPILAHLNTTLEGLPTIRVCKANDVWQAEFRKHIDSNTGAWYLVCSSNRAFALWLDIVCLLYTSIVTFSFLVLPAAEGHGGNIGLVIVRCIVMSISLQFALQQTTIVENNMTSVERVVEYANLPAEPPLESEPIYKPPADWPKHGKIAFRGLNFKYSSDGRYVLKDVNIEIESQEKIGIVGRTGAGKSSIIQALFRLAELDGIILIDGIDINTLGLHDLRSKISIIPQDPVLFSGTLRYNLDPFSEHADDDLWSALEAVELRVFVSKLNGGLDLEMSDGGSNFSVGQRQLVCLGRAILRNNKILILDEATANVDPETDHLIQKTIRVKFDGCTVLTIAHRLHTIMDNDRILVIDDGKVVEFGHPYELLQLPHGHLRAFVDQTGQQNASSLMSIAALENTTL